MTPDQFWALVDEVRVRAGAAPPAERDGTLHAVLVGLLAERLSAAEILRFHAVASHQAARADTEDLVAALLVLEGYASDDAFTDFRDGLVLLGRDAFERALADPDALVARQAAGGRPVAGVSITSCVVDAWVQVTGADDEDDFWDAVSGHDRGCRLGVTPVRER